MSLPDIWQQERARQAAWSALRLAVVDWFSPPDNIALADIQAALQMLTPRVEKEARHEG